MSKTLHISLDDFTERRLKELINYYKNYCNEKNLNIEISNSTTISASINTLYEKVFEI